MRHQNFLKLIYIVLNLYIICAVIPMYSVLPGVGKWLLAFSCHRCIENIDTATQSACCVYMCGLCRVWVTWLHVHRRSESAEFLITPLKERCDTRLPAPLMTRWVFLLTCRRSLSVFGITGPCFGENNTKQQHGISPGLLILRLKNIKH